MSVYPADVQVCLPGRGCVYYVPGAGQVLNAVIAVGPRVLDGFLAVVLGALLLAGLVAAVRVVRTSTGRGRSSRPRGLTWFVAALLLVSGVVSAIPVLVPAVVPVAEVFRLAASACAGLALLVLAGAVPRAARVVLTVAGVLRLLVLPIGVLQFLLAAPAGPFPMHAAAVISDLALAVAGAVLLVTSRGRSPLWWAFLLPPVAGLLTAVRFGLPFSGSSWIGLLPAVAVGVAGVLVLLTPPGPAVSARAARRAAALTGGIAAALGLTLAVLLVWPASSIGGREPGEPVLGVVQDVTASTRLRLPLDSYQQSGADRDLVIRAENALVRPCAARQRVVAQTADLIPVESEESNTSLLGLIDQQHAATNGYWTPPESENSGAVQSDDDLRVLASCVSAARARLGDDGAGQQFLRETTFKALQHTDGDSRVERLAAAWSRCMQLRGFAYSTPTDVALTQAVTFPTPSDTRAASASVFCEQATNLPGLRAAVLAAYENRAITEHRTQLDAARSGLLAQERRAQVVLQATSA